MNDEGSVLKVNIFGTEYPIKSDADTDVEYVRRVAQYVDHKMREVDQSTSVKTSLKVAILAALNITDELFQERAQAAELKARIAELSKRLESSLEGDS
jgi:cell division protein ZapA